MRLRVQCDLYTGVLTRFLTDATYAPTYSLENTVLCIEKREKLD